MTTFIGTLFACPKDRRVKMFFTNRMLQDKSAYPELFRDGSCRPAQAEVMEHKALRSNASMAITLPSLWSQDFSLL